eukprot:EC125216.1.p1 GENE.EC125216.1~~EC125216.1.p1  ORF type:complete len:167 (+),score=10.45 EC125216.1:235-735(+)
MRLAKRQHCFNYPEILSYRRYLTIGITKEVIKYKNILLTTLDVGGQHAIRSVWKHYTAGVDAVIFIIDSTDTRRMNEVIVELRKVLADENARDVPFLILCNKQDLPDALPASEIQERLESEIPELKSRRHHFQGVSAVSKQGLTEGLDWLCTTLRSSDKKPSSKQR